MDHPIVEPTTKDFKVAIVGGGLCGLALAVGLLKAGIDVEIFEAAVSHATQSFIFFILLFSRGSLGKLVRAWAWVIHLTTSKTSHY